ncbi:MAG: hypothetical protein GYA58_15750 [Anaerolineaceae bacterium]|nr:hypothetical protein [Anaerolineaceae bacterium]
MKEQPFPYLEPRGFSRPIPLERWLPDCPVGVIDQYLYQRQNEAGWVLDPFGANPLLDLEAAHSQRVLAAINNPVLVFLLRMLAHPREKREFVSIISRLASQSRGQERLELHLKRLYQTRCQNCRSEVQVEGYLWQRGSDQPFAKLYTCPSCGDTGERPVTEEDLQILEPLRRGEALHRGRALARVLQGSELDRETVSDALKVYQSRPLYVLFTLLNKIEGMIWEEGERELADAIMISLLEAGTSLFTWPLTNNAPHLLNVPQIFFERNLWSELERCIDLWSQPAPQVEIKFWPELLEKKGICLFTGPIRNLKSLPDEVQITSLLCLPPRPSQSFWTLSALWSAWLWGKETAKTFTQVLDRRRFDWHWHSRALQQAFAHSVKLQAPPGEVYLQISEVNANMIFATFAAAAQAGLLLKGCAYQSVEKPVQSIWQKNERNLVPVLSPAAYSLAAHAMRSFLLERGEPCEFSRLYTVALTEWARKGHLSLPIAEFDQEKSSEIQMGVEKLFTDHESFRRYDASSQELDSGKWGLVDWEGAQTVLDDRIETAINELLQKTNSLPSLSIRQALNQQFTDCLTPASPEIEEILVSYANWQDAELAWRLHENELQANRLADLKEMKRLLQQLAPRLGYETREEEICLWQEGKRVAYCFFLSTQANLSTAIDAWTGREGVPVFLFPGSRAKLLYQKMMRDGRLRERSSGWQLVKFRALRALAAQSDLNRATWAMGLGNDPIEEAATTQLRIFG